MTDWEEMRPLFERWIQSSLIAVAVIAVCMAIYPLIPTTDTWAIHRYVVMRLAAFSMGIIVLPGGVLVFDLLTPGGSFIKRVGETEYGPAILTASLCLSMAMLLCYV